MDQTTRDLHLTEDDLFRLAVPSTGEPEALPSHLVECGECGRSLQAWKRAMSELAREDEAALSRRDTEDWRAREDATLAAIRRSGAPGSHRRRLAWSMALAATLLLAAVLATLGPAEHLGFVSEEAAELSEQDRADDALLRDVAVLARGEEASSLWNGLAPLPGEESPEGENKL